MKTIVKGIWAVFILGVMLGVLISVPLAIVKAVAWAATIWFG